MTIIALVLLFAAAAGQATESTPQAPNPKQELFLRVSTLPYDLRLAARRSTSRGSETVAAGLAGTMLGGHSGPLYLELKGELRGIDVAEFQSCTIRVDRTYITPSRMKLEERAEHPCVAPAEPGAASPILAKFERELELKEPGDYLLRIMLQPKDGPPIAGMTHPVKVYKAPSQVGATATFD